MSIINKQFSSSNIATWPFADELMINVFFCQLQTWLYFSSCHY